MPEKSGRENPRPEAGYPVAIGFKTSILSKKLMEPKILRDRLILNGPSGAAGAVAVG